MLRHEPTQTYSGLTIILDEPSRFDKEKLISGYAGQYFETILAPLNRNAIDIRLCDDPSSLLDSTRVILLLGEKSLQKYATGKTGITAWRGSPLEYQTNPTITLIPTFPPQECHDRSKLQATEAEKLSEKDYQKTSRSNYRFWLYADVKKALRILRGGISNEGDISKYTVKRAPNATELRILSDTTKQQNFVVDIETDDRLRITVLGLLHRESATVYTIPINVHDGSRFYSELEEVKVWLALAKIFQNNNIIGHNVLFDFFVLAMHYKVPFPKICKDTMLMHHRCYPEIEKSLGHCISLYLDLPYHKSEGVFEPKNWNQTYQLWNYNAKDVITTGLIYDKILTRAQSFGAIASCNQANESIRSCLTMMYKGLNLDLPSIDKLRLFFSKRCEQSQRILNLLTKKILNPRSPKQVKNYLFKSLGLPEPDEDPTKEINLLKLYIKHKIPSIRAILAFREAGKLGSSLNFHLWLKDRLTCAYNIAGTETFRLASKTLLGFRNKKDSGYGTNLQNISKKVRQMVVPDDGKILVQIDQAGAEALIVAYLCMFGSFRSLFLSGIKPHVFVAMHIAPKYWEAKLGWPSIREFIIARPNELSMVPRWKELEKAIKTDDVYYFIGKTLCHASNYDMKWPTFQLTTILKSEGNLTIEADECRRLLSLYRKDLFPEISEWHRWTQDQLRKGKTLVNLFGYPRTFYGHWDDTLFKEAYAYVPQSTVGTITNIAITKLQRDIENHQLPEDLDILQNGHDSILMQCKLENKDLIIAKSQEYLNAKLVSFRKEEFQMKSEAAIGYNWAPYHETKNPIGLIEVK